MSETRAIVLAVGNTEAVEFRPIAQWLRPRVYLIQAANCDVTLEDRSGLQSVLDLILLFQDRPGVFSEEEVERLHAKFPITPLMAVLGSWCEGEQRSGRPLPGVQRMYWHQFELCPPFRVESGRLIWDESRVFPRTYSEGEKALDRFVPFLQISPDDRGSPQRALIRCSDRVTYETYRDLFARVLFEPIWWEATSSSDAQAGRSVHYADAIWDGQLHRAADWSDLCRFLVAVGDTEVTAVLGFPRAEDVQRCYELGVTVCYSKPFDSQAFVLRRARSVHSGVPLLGSRP